MQAAFGATTTSVMRENVRDESDGHIIRDTSTGGLRVHVVLDRHEIKVPDKFTYTRCRPRTARRASASSTATSTSSCATTTTSGAAAGS
eukprot:465865-Prymnesium_polylepis.1